MPMVTVRFSFYNRGTNSVVTGCRRFWCKDNRGFHGISDALKHKLNRIKKVFLNKALPGECANEWTLDDWDINGFQDYQEWHARAERSTDTPYKQRTQNKDR